jgi:hypothetical protein
MVGHPVFHIGAIHRQRGTNGEAMPSSRSLIQINDRRVHKSAA